MFWVANCLIVFLTVGIVPALGLTQNELATIENSFRGFLVGHEQLKAVRLSFHDCAGGCNGCINLNNPDNNGLQNLVGLLEAAYTSNGLASVVSRADYWAYAAVYSLKKLGEQTQIQCGRGVNTGVPCNQLMLANVTFQWGRKDCSAAPNNPDNSFEPLPSANMDHQETLDYFATEFGFSADETVALLGVHTLGHAHTENSGYNGPWVEGGANFFNNGYFQVMANESLSWSQRAVNKLVKLKFQWNAPTVGFMLNCDMALYKNIQLDDDGKSSCTYQTCTTTSTSDKVRKYATNNQDWVNDFSAVFTKMLAHGSTQLFNVAA